MHLKRNDAPGLDDKTVEYEHAIVLCVDSAEDSTPKWLTGLGAVGVAAVYGGGGGDFDDGDGDDHYLELAGAY